MPYSMRNPLATYLQRKRLVEADQSANGKDALINLAPASKAPADAVRAAWKPVQPGQAVPMVGERVYAEPDDDR